MIRTFFLLGLTFLFLARAEIVHAQLELPSAEAGQEATADPEPVIDAEGPPPSDEGIAERISAIFAEIDSLNAVDVAVEAGVVALSGEVATAEDAQRAEAIAARVSGVVTVENQLSRNLDVDDNVAPVVERLQDGFQQFVNALPLIAIALVIIILFWLLGRFLGNLTSLWNRIAPNVFLAELFATSVRMLFILVGFVIALDILGATALLGAILGGAGVIGLAVGFAMKDTVDNYVSSIMLSVRQPFRANDHVIIDGQEGRVIRLNSRATILMTLDGNHLRIPNSTVFKAQILNYTRNPERRFDFDLGIDADDDPAAAMQIGVERLRAMDFVLDDPEPAARLEQVGDSNIVIKYLGWIDQRETDWYKGRSAAVRAVKMLLEEQGFGLPEPIYRLRFDGRSDPLEIARSARPEAQERPKPKPAAAPKISDPEADVGADDEIERKVAEERAQAGEGDILDADRPIE